MWTGAMNSAQSLELRPKHRRGLISMFVSSQKEAVRNKPPELLRFVSLPSSLAKKEEQGLQVYEHKRWLQRLLACYGPSPASPVLFKLMTPMYWRRIKNLPTWWWHKADIPEPWGLSWLLQVCFMSPTKQQKWKSHNSKVKLEVGNIIKIWGTLTSKVRLFLAESLHHVTPTENAVKFIRKVCCWQSEEAFARNSPQLLATHGSHLQQCPWGTRSVFFNKKLYLVGSCCFETTHKSTLLSHKHSNFK